MPSLLHILHTLQFLCQFFLSEFLDLGFGSLCLDPHDPTAPLPPDLVKPLIVVGLDGLHQVVEGGFVLTGGREGGREGERGGGREGERGGGRRGEGGEGQREGEGERGRDGQRTETLLREVLHNMKLMPGGNCLF